MKKKFSSVGFNPRQLPGVKSIFLRQFLHKPVSVSLLAILCCISLLTLPVFAESKKDQAVVKRYSAVARSVIDFGTGGGLPQKLEFKIDNASAWLRKTGEFAVEGEIKHGSLLCGNYELGIRFGIGSPQCSNVSWITDPHYVTNRKQCNNAWMVHAGSGKEIGITSDFDQITCAQFLIKCTGKCR